MMQSNDWQSKMWAEVLAIRGVLPVRGGRVLVVSHGVVQASWPREVLVEQICWGEKLQGDFCRIVVEGCGDYEWCDVLRQLDEVLVADGKIVLVVPRPWPLGIRGSRWCGGACLRRWNDWVREAGLDVEYSTTVAGRWWIGGLGAVRVLVLTRAARLKPIVGGQVTAGI